MSALRSTPCEWPSSKVLTNIIIAVLQGKTLPDAINTPQKIAA